MVRLRDQIRQLDGVSVLRVGEALWGRVNKYEVPAASLLGRSGGHWPCGLEQVAGSREAAEPMGTLGNKVPCPGAPRPTQ